MTKLLIKNGLVIDTRANKNEKFDILIENDKIKRLSKKISLKKDSDIKIIEAKGKWVIPGIVDMHVHTREPGGEKSETVESASRAAAAGGITSILAMPNTVPATDSPQIIKKLVARAKKKALINVFFSGAISAKRAGRKLSAIKAMHKEGIKAITDDGSALMDEELLKQALKLSKKLNIPLLEHCEDSHISADGVINKGKVSARLNIPASAREAEIFIVLRDILAAASIRAPLHIQHASCRETVELLRCAKKSGICVTAEVCPHHFTFTEEDAASLNSNYKMNPPLRTKKDITALKKGLKDGTIDVIASDHAPHTKSDKRKSFIKAPFGIIGLETMLPLVISELVLKKIITKKRMVELLCLNPAVLLGLKSKGSLIEGMDADICILDPLKKISVPSKFVSKSSNSPFIGRKLSGWPIMTIVRGKVVYKR
ncbi:MAG: dihydroorotase [Elusimicrobiota bacterium]|nr:dihydroorotase [Elusimicrobiota bacterium]